MNYLLDTHTFLWFINDDKSSEIARNHIEDSQNAIYLSIASVWEMAIKKSLGKLDVPSPFEDFINQQIRINNFQILQISTKHTGVVVTLPFHHRDPFDRLIIAQSISDNMPIIGVDAAFDQYDGVKRI